MFAYKQGLYPAEPEQTGGIPVQVNMHTLHLDQQVLSQPDFVTQGRYIRY